MNDERYLKAFNAVLAWATDGGPIPDKADTLEMLEATVKSAQAYANSAMPPLRDEELAPGVIRFRTLAQLKAAGLHKEGNRA